MILKKERAERFIRACAKVKSTRRRSLAALPLESATVRAELVERRLLWQCTAPMKARVSATLRDMICFEGQGCRHGHTIDVQLSHQDLAELVGATRPIISAELVRLCGEGLISYMRC